MTLLILGVLLWSLAHLFKRLAPGVREPMGEKGKGPVALALLLSIVLMVLGYRAAEGAVYWSRTPMLVGINNLLVLFSIYIFAADGMKTRAKGWFRNPQLTAFKIWAIAHLIVNGDMPSFVLFGGLLAWAVVEVIVLNRANPRPPKPAPAPLGKEIAAVAGAVVVFGVIALIHSWLGPYPFG
ncbi:NnrU family protein [Marimonas arenosa]|uniref:NnrU family protein n=1 Tax=Marimonas arenosa TaxID=1795305 RepID=A0AAE3WGA5_9RHOB|nr:NnrU family protein [Marimonas arenosa]MDQ2092099.1 NnrU family protein [Marimonas arenosa]